MPDIINMLTVAFDDNKSVNYVVKPGTHRVERIRMLMEYSFNMCYAFGEVWMSDDRQACALILFPDKKRTSLQTLLWDLTFALSVVGIRRVRKILRREALIKAGYPQELFAYLWFVAVKPGVQGKGHGTSFMQQIIAECERKNRAIYLETSMEKNLKFYARSGFEIFKTLELTYTLYQLRRLAS